MAINRPNIWKLQADRDVGGLEKALQYTDVEIRKRAAAALRVIGTAPAIVALERALINEPNPQVRDHIDVALSYFSQGAIIQDFIKTKNVTGLVDMLQSPRQQEVMQAIQALGEIGDRTATEGLVIVFRNALLSDDLRLAAAESLLKLENAPAVIALLGALQKENWQSRHNAVIVLGQLKATWATKPLIEALNDNHAKVRKSAAWALRQLKTIEANQALAEFQQLEKRMKTAPLQNPTKPRPGSDKLGKRDKNTQQAVEIGNASQNDATHPRPPAGWKEAIRTYQLEKPEATPEAEKSEAKGESDALSPALAAAEAALAQLSPSGEALFNEDEDKAEQSPSTSSVMKPPSNSDTDNLNSAKG